MSVPDTVRHGAREVTFESYPEVGFNYRMTDIQAAVGREQLKRLPSIVPERRQMVHVYREALARVSGLRLPVETLWARSNWQSFCVGLPDSVSQREVMQALLDAGISTRRGVMCSHLEPAYASEMRAALPNSERCMSRGLILPLYPNMTGADVVRIADALVSAIAERRAPAHVR
jgi:dTDP-4-amino-4,6-dideoxygalactose transaminase